MRFYITISLAIYALIKSEKKNGISFIVKALNEENTIGNSISSLFQVNVPNEVIVILNRCTDNSEKITLELQQKNPNIQIYYYNYKLSRPGYETLATDINSNHSIIKYYNWALSKANYKWTVKWDADFIMTNEFANWINMQNFWNETNQVIKIGAKNDYHEEVYEYFSSSLEYYQKFVFYENAVHRIIPSTHIVHNLVGKYHIIHDSNKIKKYWYEKSWFIEESNEEALIVQDRINKLNEEFGEETIGLARSGINEQRTIGQKIVDAHPLYINFYD